jgi:hypothetical protein
MDTQPSPNRTHNPNTLNRRAVIAVASVAFAAGYGIAKSTEFHLPALKTEVVSGTTGIIPGDGGIETVCNFVQEVAPEHGIDPASIDCVYPGQEIASEIGDTTGRPPQPGQVIDITINRGLFGGPSVEADLPDATRTS